MKSETVQPAIDHNISLSIYIKICNKGLRYVDHIETIRFYNESVIRYSYIQMTYFLRPSFSIVQRPTRVNMKFIEAVKAANHTASDGSVTSPLMYIIVAE